LVVRQKRGLGSFVSAGWDFTTQGECNIPAYHPNGDVKTLYISIKTTLSKHMQQSGLAHEMIHAAQYVHKTVERYDKEERLIFWKGRLMKNKGPGKVPYQVAPWETDANRRGAALMRAWRKR
jgi:hypothetical protein